MNVILEKPENPFYTSTIIPDKYFCDRKKETSEIIRKITNGSNLVLMAPRRLGKSSLIHHVFAQPKILDKYYTLYVDIFGTRTAEDFIAEFQTVFMSAPLAKNTKLLKSLNAYIKGLNIELGSVKPDGSVGLPKVNFSATRPPLFSLREMFDALESADKPVLLVFDEFQQIEYYPERMAAILRGYIQEKNNTKFIFSGSSRHMLSTMFQNYSQPFFNSADTINLDIIDAATYKDFVCENFHSYGKSIEPDAIEFTYYLMSGSTYDMQRIMQNTFSYAEQGAVVTQEDIRKSIMRILEEKDYEYREILNKIKSIKDRNTLYCIAFEGIADNMTSSAVMKRYKLDNASSVQNSLENLGEAKYDHITKLSKGIYQLRDRMFELWLANKAGILDGKFAEPKSRFERERQLQSDFTLR